MYRLILLTFLINSNSCTTSKIVSDHGECYVAAFNMDNSLNDTTRVKFIRSVVFDTTAILIHVYITDAVSHLPIRDAQVKLFTRNAQVRTYTNSTGEFELFQNLYYGPWNLYITHPDYICIYVTDVIKTGGQWFMVKLERK